MYEYSDFNSHLEMRLMDYGRMRAGNVPNDEQFLAILGENFESQKMNPELFNKDFLDQLKGFL